MIERRALPEAQEFDVLAVGCSAGGVEALGQLLPAIAPSVPFAVVVVLHLLSDVDSGLSALFADKCKIPVREALDKEPIRAGVIYFAPPAYHLSVEPSRVFSLSVEEPIHYCRPSIDVLFESVAFAYQKRAVGLLLTGSNDDGACGLSLMLEAGGAALIQDPATAMFPAMPQAGISAVARKNQSATVLTLALLRGWCLTLGEECE